MGVYKWKNYHKVPMISINGWRTTSKSVMECFWLEYIEILLQHPCTKYKSSAHCYCLQNRKIYFCQALNDLFIFWQGADFNKGLKLSWNGGKNYFIFRILSPMWFYCLLLIQIILAILPTQTQFHLLYNTLKYWFRPFLIHIAWRPKLLCEFLYWHAVKSLSGFIEVGETLQMHINKY